MDGKTEGRLHNIAHSAWLTGKSWEVTAWLLCNQDVTEINVKNRTLLPVKVSELIKEMIFSMFVAATALSPDEFRHFVSGRGSVGAVRLDEWDLKSPLQTVRMREGSFPPADKRRGDDDSRAHLTPGRWGAQRCCEEMDFRERRCALKRLKWRKVETQAGRHQRQNGRCSWEEDGREQIRRGGSLRSSADIDKKDKTWPANKDPSLHFLPIYLLRGLFSRVFYFMFWQCGANVKSGHKTNLVRLRKRTCFCLYATEIWRCPAYASKMWVCLHPG